MKMERSKNAARNVVFGGINKLYQILIPFVIKTAIIHFLGMQYMGLDTLFISILQVLNLAELGVGSAKDFSMYRPMAEGDKKKICQLMNLYKKYYRIIGIIILVVGVAILPLIPKLINDGKVPPGMNVYVLYLLNLGTTVLSYWLFAYKNSLLSAFQRNDIGSKISIITATIKYALQFLVLFLFRNYYFYLLISLATQIINNIVTAIVVDRIYPEYKAMGQLPKEEVKVINGRVKDLFTSKIGGVIVNSADSIVISAFLGLTVLAVYNSYYYVLTSVIGFVVVIFQACTAGIGNSLLVESKEKNFNDLKKFTHIIAWISGMGTACLLCLYQPFMIMWIGEENILAIEAVVCFCIYYFVYEINQLLNMYKDAGGMWHEDRFRPLATAICNLVLNLILVNVIGIYGVLASTVISMLFVGMPWLLHNLFSVMFDSGCKEYLFRLVYYSIVTAIVSAISYKVCGFVHCGGIIGFILKLIICVTISAILFFIFYFRMREFKEVKQMVKKILKR